MPATNSEHVLVKGDFTPEEARDAILALIEDKIRYHRQRNFTMEERFGLVSEHSQARIQQLQLSLEEVEAIIAYAEENGKTLRVGAEIKIELL